MPKGQAQIFDTLNGGLSTLAAPNRISDADSPTNQDVWFDTNALIKRNGCSASAGQTGYGSSWTGIATYPYTNSGGSSFNIILHLNVLLGDGVTTASSAPLGVYGGVNVGPIRYAGTSGTVATTSGSAIITGTGTVFLTDFETDAIIYNGVEYLVVSSVDSNLQITARSNAANTNSGLGYFCYPAWPSNYVVSLVSMNSKVWVCGKGNTPISYNGTTVSRVSAFPKASFSLVNKNYVFAANTAANPSRVSWSFLKDPTVWPASNFVDVNPDDGFPIVGMFYDGQSIVILKTTSAYKLSGDVFDPANPTYTLTRIYTPPDFKCGTAKSVQFLNNAYVILGTRGLYQYQGGGQIGYMAQSDQIRADWAAVQGTLFANDVVNTQEPKSIVYNGNYIVAVQSSLFSTNTNQKNAMYVFDRSGKFWRWVPAASSSRVSDLCFYNSTLTAIGAGGLLNLDSGSSDQSTAINGTWTSKIFQYAAQQRFGVAYLYFKKQAAGNIVFEYSVDEGAFTAVNVDMTQPSSTRGKSPIIMIGRVGLTIQFRFSNNVLAQGFEIYGFQFERIPLEE